MSENISKTGIRNSQISAVIIRADGTREELGVISYWDKNPFKRLAFWLRTKLDKFLKLSHKA